MMAGLGAGSFSKVEVMCGFSLSVQLMSRKRRVRSSLRIVP